MGKSTAEELPRVKPVGNEGFDFIDEDADRFNIFVRKVGVEGDTIEVEVSTTNLEGKTGWNDAVKKIKLVRMSPLSAEWSDWFISDSQILVSNQADDQFTREAAPWPNNADRKGGGIGADDVDQAGGAVNEKLGLSFPVGDRTHRIAPGGTFTAKYGEATDQVGTIR